MNDMTVSEVEQVLALEKYLDRHDELLKASRAQYQTYRGDGIEDLPFQRDLVKGALSRGRQWAAEIATGVGKTIISARIALKRASDGPVIYVCPNRTAVGDGGSGIINKFARTFDTFGTRKTYTMGRVNELSRANDVSFITPYALAYLLRHDSRRTREMIRRASCFVIDEAHHFPEDKNDDLKVYGAIFDAADQLVRDGLTVAMTGTWERLDGMPVMGRDRPDVTVTVQDAVDLGRCPELYGVQVITDVVAKKVRACGDLYDIHLAPDERVRYLQGVADCMLTTRRRYPVPFAGFVRTMDDAYGVQAAYNRKLRRGEPKLGLLLSVTSIAERLATVRAISQGQLAGYVTCAVGEEALDLPKLEVVHLVRRTRSYARNMQAIGRALRVCEGKRRALVIDYQTMLSGVTDRFIGLTLEEVAERQGTRMREFENGGPLVVQRTYQGAQLAGMTMGEERVLVCRTKENTAALAKQTLLELARTGQRRPRSSNRRNNTTVPREEALLARKLYNYTEASRGTCYDAPFDRQLRAMRPDWFNKARPKEKKAQLLEMALSGQVKPARSSKDKSLRLLAVALYNYIYPGSRAYDKEFAAKIRAANPMWLDRQRVETETLRNELLEMAGNGQSKPPWDSKHGKALSRYTEPASKGYDMAFTAQMLKIAPRWFVKTSTTNKRILLDWARSGKQRPSVGSNNHSERCLGHVFYKYVTPSSKSYDAQFVEDMRAIRPEWLNRRTYKQQPSSQARMRVAA